MARKAAWSRTLWERIIRNSIVCYRCSSPALLLASFAVFALYYGSIVLNKLIERTEMRKAKLQRLQSCWISIKGYSTTKTQSCMRVGLYSPCAHTLIITDCMAWLPSVIGANLFQPARGAGGGLPYCRLLATCIQEVWRVIVDFSGWLSSRSITDTMCIRLYYAHGALPQYSKELQIPWVGNTMYSIAISVTSTLTEPIAKLQYRDQTCRLHVHMCSYGCYAIVTNTAWQALNGQ